MLTIHRQKYLLRALWAAPAAITLMFSTLEAQAQCEVDADCGFGFVCNHETAGGSTTGSATSGSATSGSATTGSESECGNGWCEEGETPASCPDDCYEFTYCVGAPCTASDECSAGYSCEHAGGVYSTTTTGASGAFCGNSVCEPGETEESCYQDCTTDMTCQPEPCQADEDCEEGYYCNLAGGSASAVVTAGSDGSTSTSGYVELQQSQCVLEGEVTSDSGGSASATTGAGVGGAVGDNDTVSGSGGSGGAVGSTSASVSGTVSTTGAGSGTGGVSSGNSGSGGAGHGHGHGKIPWPKGPNGGCSIAESSETQQSPWSLLAFAAASVVALRRRRS